MALAHFYSIKKTEHEMACFIIADVEYDLHYCAFAFV